MFGENASNLSKQIEKSTNPHQPTSTYPPTYTQPKPSHLLATDLSQFSHQKSPKKKHQTPDFQCARLATSRLQDLILGLMSWDGLTSRGNLWRGKIRVGSFVGWNLWPKFEGWKLFRKRPWRMNGIFLTVIYGVEDEFVWSLSFLKSLAKMSSFQKGPRVHMFKAKNTKQ